MCMCVLDLVVYGWKGWSNKRQALCSLFFSLCLSYGCFPLKIPLFSVAISLSLLVSLSLTPFSFLRLDHQQRRRVKFSLFFLLIFCLCTLNACSSDHTSVSSSSIPHHSWLLYLSVLPFLPLFTMEQLYLRLNLKFRCWITEIGFDIFCYSQVNHRKNIISAVNVNTT